MNKYKNEILKGNETALQKVNKIQTILEKWDCNMAVRGEYAVGAAIYGVWEQKILIRFFQDLTDDVYVNNR